MEFWQVVAMVAGAGGAISTVVTVWNILQGPSRGLGTRVGAVEERADLMDKRLVHVETELEQLPTKDALHDLQMTVERLNSDIRVLSETMRGVKETSNLVRDYLLEEAKRAS